MPRFLVKLFSFLVSIALVFAVVFSYEIFSAGQKIFSQSEEPSIIRQFEKMIFNPTRSLKGEKSNRINILLLGIGGKGHSGSELTDTIMIASIKPRSKKAAILSIPRDLYVKIPDTNVSRKINAVRVYGDRHKDGSGLELLKKTIKEVSGLDIHYYVQLDFKGFIEVVDKLGGIDVYVEDDIDDYTYPDFNYGYDPFHISRGWHHLNGSDALKVARSRHSKMGDFDRIKRQQAIIKSLKQKVFEKYSRFDIFVFREMTLSLSNNLKTDIQLDEMRRLYSILKEIRNHNIKIATIDTRKYLRRAHVGKMYALRAKSKNGREIKNLSKNLFSMEVSDEKTNIIRQENASVEIRNGTGNLDLANNVASDLEKLGYRIVNSENIDPPAFSGVRIYYKANNSKNTLHFLKEKFNAVIIDVSNDERYKSDFAVVLGKGF